MFLVKINDKTYVNPNQVVLVYECTNLRGGPEVRVQTTNCIDEDAIGFLSKHTLEKTLKLLGDVVKGD